MEEYWKPDDQQPVLDPNDQAALEQDLFDEAEPNSEEYVPDYPEEPEPPKPKKKKKMTFKRRVRRAIRRFFKLPLLTRIIAGVLVLVVLVVLIVLLIVLPKNCKSSAGDKASESANPSDQIAVVDDTPEATEPTEPTDTPEPPQVNTPVPRIADTVKPNSSDAAVPFLRQRLVDLGYMEMPATNDELYDAATVNAVKRFQQRNFPDSYKAWDGYIGNQTYEQLVSSAAKAFYMKSGDTDQSLYDGELVSKMQNKLVALGYLKSMTGNYDKATVDAVRKFQKDNSLESDGVAGQGTLKLLATKVLDAIQTTPNPETVISDPTANPDA